MNKKFFVSLGVAVIAVCASLSSVDAQTEKYDENNMAGNANAQQTFVYYPQRCFHPFAMVRWMHGFCFLHRMNACAYSYQTAFDPANNSTDPLPKEEAQTENIPQEPVQVEEDGIEETPVEGTSVEGTSVEETPVEEGSTSDEEIKQKLVGTWSASSNTSGIGTVSSTKTYNEDGTWVITTAVSGMRMNSTGKYSIVDGLLLTTNNAAAGVTVINIRFVDADTAELQVIPTENMQAQLSALQSRLGGIDIGNVYLGEEEEEMLNNLKKVDLKATALGVQVMKRQK